MVRKTPKFFLWDGVWVLTVLNRFLGVRGETKREEKGKRETKREDSEERETFFSFLPLPAASPKTLLSHNP